MHERELVGINVNSAKCQVYCYWELWCTVSGNCVVCEGTIACVAFWKLIVLIGIPITDNKLSEC